MAKFEDGCYGTLKGIALIAKVLAGRCRMHYTRVAVGKGTIPEDLTPKTLPEPPEYVMDALISSVTNPVDGECQVSVQMNSAFVEKGFYVTWLVLYAEDPDEGEVAFTTLCLENEPEWIRPSSSIVGKLAHFDIIAAVGDVDTVSATIDPDALATLDSVRMLLEEHEKNPDAHPALREALDAALDEVRESAGGGVKASLSFSIQPEDWAEADGVFRYDLADPETAAEDVPLVILETGGPMTAESFEGVTRLTCKVRPTQTVSGVCHLLGRGGGGSGSRIKVAEGSGLLLNADGSLSLDTASRSEVLNLFPDSNG